jgi:hypothetical protein
MRKQFPFKCSPVFTLLIYSGLTIVMTWPVAGLLGTHIPGSGRDTWVHQWTFRWVRDALLAGKTPFYTNLLFHPYGTSLVFHNFAWLHIAVWLPLQAIIGVPEAYSIVFLATFAFNGFAVYLLARDLTQSEIAAFIGGLVCGFWPYILSHHNHPNLILVGWVPLTLLYLKRTIEKQRVSDAWITACFVALVGITRWQSLVLGGILIGFYYIYQLTIKAEYRTWQILKLSLLVGIAALVIMLPLLSPLLISQITREYPDDIFVHNSGQDQSDLLAYIVPNCYHPWWGETVRDRFYNNFQRNKFFTPFVGYTTLALAVYGTIKQWRRARFWFWATLLYLFLALGPELLINGRTYLPLPYQWIGSTFFIRIVRYPDRFNVILAIPIAILVSFGSMTLYQHPKLNHRQSTLVLVLCIGLILIEYVVKYPMYRLDVPEWYSQLSQEEGDFAILELPMDNRGDDEEYMYYQSVHGKPLVGGHVSRPPRETFAFINQVPMLQGFPENQDPPSDLVNVGHQLYLLAKADIHYLVLHKRHFSQNQLAGWREWLSLEPVHEDDELVVYNTTVIVGHDVPLMSSGVDGLGVIRTSITPTSTVQEGYVEIAVRWGSQTSVSQDYDVCFNVVNSQGETGQSDCQPISQIWPTGQWQANEIVDAVYTLRMSPFLASGAYTVTATLAHTGTDQPIGAPMAGGQIQFTAIPRVFAVEEWSPSGKIDVNWGDVITLTDYDIVETNPNRLDISLRWKAQQRMDASYKVFIHLLDANTGELVSQVDAVPRNWGYPTNWWEQGEIVTDTLSLPLGGVNSGQYTLWLGLYDIATGQRLQVDVGAATAPETANDAIRLGEISR